MVKNQLKYWSLLDDMFLNEKFSIDEITDTQEGLSIIFSNINELKFELVFFDYYCFQKSDESFLSIIWESNTKDILGKNFYIIENSEYINFFNSMSLETYKDNMIVHYAIYTANDCIDIISETPPILRTCNP